jgi:hypothetical protein
MYVKKVRAAGIVAATAAAGALFSAAPASATNAGILNKGVVNVIPVQTCATEIPVIAVPIRALSPDSTKHCINGSNHTVRPEGTYDNEGIANDLLVNVVPVQLCATEIPVIAVPVRILSPDTTGDCINASADHD